jgi:hypothetical protein
MSPCVWSEHVPVNAQYLTEMSSQTLYPVKRTKNMLPYVKFAGDRVKVAMTLSYQSKEIFLQDETKLARLPNHLLSSISWYLDAIEVLEGAILCPLNMRVDASSCSHALRSHSCFAVQIAFMDSIAQALNTKGVVVSFAASPQNQIDVHERAREATVSALRSDLDITGAIRVEDELILPLSGPHW